MKMKRRNREVVVEELDITSLLDILVILLVFLLMSFNASDLTIDLINNLTLPYSKSMGMANHGVVVQVNNKKEIWVNKNRVGVLSSSAPSDVKITRVLRKLASVENQKIDKSRQDEPKYINLIFDKGLEYQDIQVVLHSAAEAGFGKYKLIVQGVE